MTLSWVGIMFIAILNSAGKGRGIQELDYMKHFLYVIVAIQTHSVNSGHLTNQEMDFAI